MPPLNVAVHGFGGSVGANPACGAWGSVNSRTSGARSAAGVPWRQRLVRLVGEDDRARACRCSARAPRALRRSASTCRSRCSRTDRGRRSCCPCRRAARARGCPGGASVAARRARNRARRAQAPLAPRSCGGRRVRARGRRRAGSSSRRTLPFDVFDELGQRVGRRRGARPREVVGGGRELGAAARRAGARGSRPRRAGRAPARVRAARASSSACVSSSVCAASPWPPCAQQRRRCQADGASDQDCARAVEQCARAAKGGAGRSAPAASCRRGTAASAALRSAAVTRPETVSGAQAAVACSAAPVVRVDDGVHGGGGDASRRAEAATHGSVRHAARSSYDDDRVVPPRFTCRSRVRPELRERRDAVHDAQRRRSVPSRGRA